MNVIVLLLEKMNNKLIAELIALIGGEKMFNYKQY